MGKIYIDIRKFIHNASNSDPRVCLSLNDCADQSFLQNRERISDGQRNKNKQIMRVDIFISRRKSSYL